jgi:Fic family protein
MQPEDFSATSPGRLIRSSEGFWCFVPAPLPPSLTPTWSLTSQLSNADRAIAELAGVGGMLPNPHFLIGPFLRREAVLSSRIEGTTATAQQLALFEVAGVQQTHDESEVQNYVRALELGLELLQELPISLRLIRKVHARLLTGVRGNDAQPGEFRKQQNMIAAWRGQSPLDAPFVPPPVREMETALHDLERYIHAESDLPLLVRLALTHYQFEAIHPFMDGNGRMGRLLLALILCAEHYLPQPLLYLSAYFEKHRDAYMAHLLRVSQTGAWDEWLSFFLAGVSEQARDAVRRAHRLITLQHSYREVLQSPRGSSLAVKLVDSLFATPAITAPLATRLLDVTPRAAQLTIDKLVAAGIIRHHPSFSHPRVYVCDEIVEVIQAERF